MGYILSMILMHGKQEEIASVLPHLNQNIELLLLGTSVAGLSVKLPDNVHCIPAQDGMNDTALLNAGLALAIGENLLLASDGVLPEPETLQQLFHELSVDPLVGAVGPAQAWLTTTIPIGGRYCFFLRPACMLLKREAFIKTGFFDMQMPLARSAVDYSFRLLQQGYRLRRAVRCFLTGVDMDWRLRPEAEKMFQDKWGFSLRYTTTPRMDLLSMMDRNIRNPKVLSLGCACGADFMILAECCPEGEYCGVEYEAGTAAIARLFANVLCGDVEMLVQPDWQMHFDYVIMGDILEHLRSPLAALKKVYGFLRPGGALLLSTPNVGNISIVDALLHGRWRYQDSGILDRTHLRFFTLKELQQLAVEAGFVVEQIHQSDYLPEELQQMADGLVELGADRKQLSAFQYKLCLRRPEV